MEKIQRIRNLEALIQVCISKERDFLHMGGRQHDARVTFFKHIIKTVNTCIHFTIFSDTILLTEDWWLKKLPKYKINRRNFSTIPLESRQVEKDYIEQYLLISYFNFVFNTFESSFRIICENCFSDVYYVTKENKDRWKIDIKNLCQVVLLKLNLMDKDRENF